jgi:hypothetical protein
VVLSLAEKVFGRQSGAFELTDSLDLECEAFKSFRRGPVPEASDPQTVACRLARPSTATT